MRIDAFGSAFFLLHGRDSNAGAANRPVESCDLQEVSGEMATYGVAGVPTESVAEPLPDRWSGLETAGAPVSPPATRREATS